MPVATDRRRQLLTVEQGALPGGLNSLERETSNSQAESMKRIVLTMVAMLVGLPAQAQLFTQESVGGAAFGGLIGGIIGHNSGRRTAEGIGIGAGAGFLFGALAHQSRRDRYYYGAEYYYYGHPPYYAAPRQVAWEAPGTVYVSAASSTATVAQPNVSHTQVPSQPRLRASSVPAPASSMAGANSLFGR
jgi:hypothetical protein